jgi:hypothetical protein
MPTSTNNSALHSTARHVTLTIASAPAFTHSAAAHPCNAHVKKYTNNTTGTLGTVNTRLSRVANLNSVWKRQFCARFGAAAAQQTLIRTANNTTNTATAGGKENATASVTMTTTSRTTPSTFTSNSLPFTGKSTLGNAGNANGGIDAHFKTRFRRQMRLQRNWHTPGGALLAAPHILRCDFVVEHQFALHRSLPSLTRITVHCNFLSLSSSSLFLTLLE